MAWDGSFCFWCMVCLRLDRPYTKSKRNPIQGYGQIKGLVDDELQEHRDHALTTRRGR